MDYNLALLASVNSLMANYCLEKKTRGKSIGCTHVLQVGTARTAGTYQDVRVGLKELRSFVTAKYEYYKYRPGPINVTGFAISVV